MYDRKTICAQKAFNDVEMNFMFHEDLAKILKLIDYNGIINVGGPKRIVLNFAKKTNDKILSISAKKVFGKKFPLKQTMNINKFKKILKKY